MLIKELAAASGVNRRTIDNYLSVHECAPSAGAAVKIARVLGVSVEYLMTGTDFRAPQALGSLAPDIRLVVKTLQGLPRRDRRLIAQMALLFKKEAEDAGG
ncbi:MAG: helix-turn-helix transcriptional regulator [Spirochaetaceae bacterium]|nr:helix-turn-helix transcriptional regulator [Spirochaetaceae bacterium]